MNTETLTELIKELEKRKRALDIADKSFSSLSCPDRIITLNPFGEIRISLSDFATSGMEELLLDFLKVQVSNAEEAIKQEINNQDL